MPTEQPDPAKGISLSIIEDPEGPVPRRIKQFIEDLDIRMPTPDETSMLAIPPGVPVARVLPTALDARAAE